MECHLLHDYSISGNWREIVFRCWLWRSKLPCCDKAMWQGSAGILLELKSTFTNSPTTKRRWELSLVVIANTLWEAGGHGLWKAVHIPFLLNFTIIALPCTLHGCCFPGPSAQASSSFWNVLLSEASLSDTHTLLKPQCRAACPPQSLAFYAALITAEVSTYVCDVYFSTMNVGTEALCASYTAPMPGTEQAWVPSESMWSEWGQ